MVARVAPSLVAVVVGCGPEPAPRPITLYDLQVRGTHNSYHQAPPGGSRYGPGMPPLRDQLESGIRQFEFDIHYDDEVDDFRVYHLPEVDPLSSCDRLLDCLAELKVWSDAHPEHAPLLIFIEPKDDLDSVSIHPHFHQLESLVDRVWPRTRVVRPDDVRGTSSSVARALRSEGWPALETMRQRALFFLFDHGENRRQYLNASPDLIGSQFFVTGTPDEPATALVSHDDPITEAPALAAAIRAGFLTRTRAETPEAAQAAAHLGVHILSTDHPAELLLEGKAASRCNPVTAPTHCHDALIERPASGGEDE